jgi:hypothetical protein
VAAERPPLLSSACRTITCHLDTSNYRDPCNPSSSLPSVSSEQYEYSHLLLWGLQESAVAPLRRPSSGEKVRTCAPDVPVHGNSEHTLPIHSSKKSRQRALGGEKQKVKPKLVLYSLAGN